MSKDFYFYKLTKYEKTKVLGIRAEQISRGAPSTVDIGDLIDPIDIAKKEFAEYKIPLIIERNIPDRKPIKIKLYGNKDFY